MNIRKRLISLCLVLSLCFGGVTMPIRAADSPVTRAPEDAPTSFADVKETDWFCHSAYYALGRGLMLGTGNNMFSPAVTTNRAMLVTILYRMEMEPEAAPAAFKDVPPGKWYTDAINWAAAQGIVNGMSEDRFDPDGKLTREQFAVILYRFAAYRGLDVSTAGDLSGFDDENRISAYARTAMEWAVGTGLIRGMTQTTLSPGTPTTRAQTAELLMRFERNILVPTTEPGNDDNGIVPVTPSLTVPPDEMIVLEADVRQVTVLEPVTVTFTLATSLVVPEFRLFCGGTDTGAVLNDRGEGADEDALDGSYTGAYTFTPSDSPEDLAFTARAQVGEQTAISETCILEPWKPISEETYAQLEAIWGAFDPIFAEVEAEAGPDADPLDVAARTKNEVLLFLREQYALGNIESFNAYPGADVTAAPEEEYTVSYTVGGLEFGVCCIDTEPPQTELSEREREALAQDPAEDACEGLDDEPGIQPEDGPLRRSARKGDAPGKYANALILCYDKKDDGVHANASADFKKTLENGGMQVTTRYKFSADDLRSMTGYDYIEVASHGAKYCGYPCIITGQTVSYNVLNHYGADMRKRRVVAVYTSARGNRIWAYPKLLTDYYRGARCLNASLVNLSCCYGGANRKLATGFLRAGANAVTAYNNEVYVSYDHYLLLYELKLLLKGHTIAQAVAAGKKRYGRNDGIWAEEHLGSKHWKKNNAEQRIFGVNYSTLYQPLLNWSFLGYDSEERRYYPSLSNWTKEGKATAVTRQGTIKPEYGFMARLTTKGRGEYGSSALYQTFLVPDDADFLEFDYQMLTTERQKGDYGNDFLRISLLDQYGNALESMVYESVNSTTWYWSQTTGFDGDNWVAVSHWKHVLCTRMWRYRGQVVTLRVFLRENGNPKAYSGALFSCVWLE